MGRQHQLLPLCPAPPLPHAGEQPLAGRVRGHAEGTERGLRHRVGGRAEQDVLRADHVAAGLLRFRLRFLEQALRALAGCRSGHMRLCRITRTAWLRR